MRRVLGILLVLLLAAGAAGCGNSETSSIYTAGGSWDLEEKILTANTTVAQSSYLPENGTRVQRTIAHETLPVKFIIDADMQIQCSEMPSAKVEPHRFTQGEVDAIMEYLIGNSYFAAPLFDYELNNHQKYLSNKNAQKPVNELPEASRTLGETKDKYIATWSFSGEGYYEEAYIVDQIDGIFEKDGTLTRFKIFSDETGKWSMMEYSQPFHRPYSKFRKDKISPCVAVYEDALKIAENTVKGIGAYQQGMRLADASVTKKSDGSFSSCDFIYTRELSGAQCGIYFTYFSETYKSSDIHRRNKNTKSSWGYENLEIKVDEYGLTYVMWGYPYQITEILTDHTSIQPFDKIIDCFAKTVLLKYSDFKNMHEWEYITGIEGGPNGILEEPGVIDSETDYIEGHINKISLNLMRVQSGEEYFLIPVWDFYGDITRLKKKGDETIEMKLVQNSSILMTINAIDGSLIDRLYGY